MSTGTGDPWRLTDAAPRPRSLLGTASTIGPAPERLTATQTPETLILIGVLIGLLVGWVTASLDRE